MEWIRLRSESIGALALLMLSLVVALYLLSIPNKSRDGRRITILFILFVFDHLAGVIGNSITGIWSAYLLQLQDVGFVITIIYQVRFIYGYQQNPFKREMQVMILVSIFFYAVVLYFQPRFFLWTSLLHLLSFLWVQVVLLRKIVSASMNNKSFEIQDNRNKLSFGFVSLKIWMERLVREFKSPADRISKAYQSFAWWNISNIVFGINVTLLVTHHNYDLNYWVLVHLALLLISLIWLVITYLNYSVEPATFPAKVVGLVLCFTLMLLGLLAAMLYGRGVASGLIGEQQQKGLKTLAILIPVVTIFIIAVIPFFLRRNLLRPLNRVLQGVKDVNAGDLTKDVVVEVNDEIGYLTKNFNQMTQSLRRYTNEMESLVIQRTTELENQKEELQHTLEDLKATQSQLIQSEKMASLGELTAGIAHEIQNPLNFVNNFSDVNTELIEELKSELQADNKQDALSIADDIKENEQKINHHGKRADAIVKGMLQHSRASTGQKEPTDINALADEYLRLSYHGLRAKDKAFNAALETNFDENIGKIEIVPQDIGRVLLNLFNNAFYAVTEKKKASALKGENYQPTVRVTTKRISFPSGVGGLEISVSDNGNGIPAKVVDKIFQPFFTTKPTGRGTGLGLSLSYDIVKVHGGEIKVISTEGEDAEFIIQLPL